MKYLLALLLIALSAPLFSTTYTIGTGGDFPNLESVADLLMPGDTALLLSQEFRDGTQFLENVNGERGNRIVILALERHKAVFIGGTEAIHLINCSYIIIEGLRITGQSGNGINIDDGGDYSSPTHHILIKDCYFHDMAGQGNNDFLKLSGLDNFWVWDCRFENGGAGGSGIDMVGCHEGLISGCYLDNAGITGIQAKGGH